MCVNRSKYAKGNELTQKYYLICIILDHDLYRGFIMLDACSIMLKF